ncbi:signal transduction histidine kinase [Microbacterium endophyticum]|uniref:Sensor-like histidine kinase SenX3 n=1 Tax=Microbacterium endophyticum TaxID=1526412 RepID=A0A7W4YLT0_9MICO|nr:HAMP domain-containing sensor histidine kinase [Microbacterium endophyticum]MBB2975488.1 signal transduction histidine kinase [Microbacterium endophyticum]NIK35493.1 signal transduction histidine kinase [Microbacterium endophyticum]
MPMFELELTPTGRRRVFLRGQFPFFVGALFVGVVVALVYPQAYETWPVITAYVLVFATTLAAFFIPWERFKPMWMLPLPIIDMIAVGFLRAELYTVLAAAAMLAIFPILWLAYGFFKYAVWTAALGAAFITSFTFFYNQAWPATALAWANVITLPIIIIVVARVVQVAARQLSRRGEQLYRANEKQAAALREALDNQILARSILNTVNAGVAFYDSRGRLALANNLASQMTEAVGFRIDTPPYAGEQVRAADRVTPIPFDEQIIPRALRGEEMAEHMEWLGPPDQQAAIIASTRRVLREDGELLGTVIVAYDVTELATAIDVREQFLKTVSHELRTPMTSIMGFLDLIDDAVDPREKKVHEYLAVVSRKSQDLMDRIGELLAAADREDPLQILTTDVDRVIELAVESVRERAAARGITLERVGNRDLDARIDGRRIRQVVSELLVNAIKFGREHSAITVAQELRGDRVRISVTNLGPGLGRGEQGLIFDRFYRTDDARRRAIQGFGIGLTFVKNAVAAHDGRVLINSDVDRGDEGLTTFAIDLPA